MFEVFGPFNVPEEKGRGGRGIGANSGSAFWKKHLDASALRSRIGCYVFAISAGGGYRPVYVGRTKKSFEQEVFQYHKRDKYNSELRNVERGKPVMFFIVHPEGRGIPNIKMINDI